MSAKHIFTIVAAGAMLLAACGKKTNTDKDMNTLSFNKEQAAAMTAIVALFEWVADSTEGINELSIFNSQFSIYPNLASMTVTVETDQPSSLTLTDATGRVCGQWKVENGKTALDISPLSAGVYFVRLSTSPTIRKLIIR